MMNLADALSTIFMIIVHVRFNLLCDELQGTVENSPTENTSSGLKPSVYED